MKIIYLLRFFIIYIITNSCSTVRRATEIPESFYKTSKPFKIDSLNVDLVKGKKIYIEDYLDYILLYNPDSINSTPIQIITAVTSKQPLNLQVNSFDVDLFIIPFKIRSAQRDVPVQINTNFNASCYFGYRRDILKITSTQKFSQAYKRNVIRNGIGSGGFIGLSSTAINPSVTQGQVNIEYDGFAISYGFSTIHAVEKFNAGIALGFDYLIDKNRIFWNYQNKPWIGVLIGLNIN